MAHEFVDQTLQVNLSNQNPVVPHTGGDIAVPNTGFIGEVINNLGVVGCSLVLIALGAFILGIVVLLLRSKFHRKIARTIPRISFITGVILFLVAIACAIPASLKTVEAINITENTTTIDLTIPEGQNSAVATKDTTLTLGQDYPDGYAIFAYTDQDNKLHNTELWDTVFMPTPSISSLDKMPVNTYGVKNEQQNYVALSTDANRPTRLKTQDVAESAGVTIPITYAVKADNTMPSGLYRNATASIHFEIAPDVYHLTYAGWPEEHVVEQKHNATFTLDSAPSKTGYTFKEYNTKPDGSGGAYYPGDLFTTLSTDATIYVIWQAKQPTVTFKANGGAFAPGVTTKNITETYDSNYILPTPNPSRTGYTFAGWYTDATSGDPVTADTIVNNESNHSLYAHWTANTYQTTFDAGEGIFPGSGEHTQKVNEIYDNNYILPESNPSRIGWTFDGWYTAKTGGDKVTANTKVTTAGDHSLYAHWIENTYILTYDANQGSGAPAPVTQKHNPKFTIATSPELTREGYHFKGWTDAADSLEVKYEAGEEIILDEPSAGTTTSAKTLYAIWLIDCNPTATTISNAICLQDMNPSVRETMTTEQQYRLYDSRDNKQYYLAKLKDENIWMTQNLDFDIIVDKHGNSNVTTEDSNVSADWTMSSPNGKPTATSRTVFNSTDLKETLSWDPGNYYYDGSTIEICGDKTSYEGCAGFATSGDAHYHIGNLYQFNTVTAGMGQTGREGSVDKIPDSICPKGWRLPTGNTNGEFAALARAYGYVPPLGIESQVLINSPMYFVRGGSVYGGQVHGASYFGYDWSSVIVSDYRSLAYEFFLNSSNIENFDLSDPQFQGMSARCVAAMAVYKLNYDANGGGNAPATQIQTDNPVMTISNTKPTREGFTFKGWASTPDATEADPALNPGKRITLDPPTTTSLSEKTLYAVWKVDATTYRVKYDANGGSGVPSTQTYAATGSETDHTFTLTDLTSDKIPTRSGYTFGGWTTVATNQAGAYSPGSELYLTKDNPEITLYAIWVPNSEMGFGSLTGDNAKMQNMTSSVCSAVSQGTTGRLQDTRDYKIYYVTKEADNKCWMTQNLALEISKDKTYTSADTNITDGNDFKPGESASSYKSTVPKRKLNSSTWATSSDYTHPYSFNPADDYFVTNGATSGDDPETTSGDAHYTAGNYYTWSAAVASNNTEGHITDCENMPDSICPKGWRLPQTTSSSSTEFGALLHATGITSSDTSSSYATDGFINIRKSPLWLVRSGRVNSGSRDYLGSYGVYWSSAVYSSSNAYDLYFHRYSPSPMYSYGRNFGQSIRCLAV